MKRKSMKVLVATVATVSMLGGEIASGISLRAFENVAVFDMNTIENRTGSITVNKQTKDKQPLAGATFAIYKVMSFTPSTADASAKYEPTTDFAQALQGIKADELGTYSATEMEKLITTLTATANTADVKATASMTTPASGTVTFANLELGYYLVVETSAPDGYVAGKPFLIAVPSSDNYTDETAAGTKWVYDVTATPKNEKVTIHKELTAESDGSVAIGDFVQYQITTLMPSYTDDYFEGENKVVFEIQDTMDDGLAIQNDSDHAVTVKVNDAVIEASDTTYAITAANVSGETADLKIVFTKAFLKAHKGEKVAVTYYAKVTEKAIQGNAGNENAAVIVYNHKPNATTTSEKETAYVYSFGINVKKFTKEGTPQVLEGAKFVLLEKDGKTQIGEEKSTNADGEIAFSKLDEGTYYLKETASPTGYTLLAEAIKVEIIAEKDETTKKANGRFTVKVNDQEVNATTGEYSSYIDEEAGTANIAVENHKGFTLPSTGGMGITVFLAIGGIGILGISIVMLKKSRKQA